jgi:cation diffusion facilitator family transporter
MARTKHRQVVFDTVEVKNIAVRISWVSIVMNTLLSVGKLAAGIFAHSGAMISDAVHSASDVLSTVMVIFGVSMAAKREDADHPYGHERLECVTALLLASLLFVTGIGIGVSGISSISLALSGELAAPGVLALWAAAISIAVKEGMFWYTRAAAEKTNSGALMADAWHHRSDALSSIGSFVGILGARLGLPILDPIAALVICFFILKVAFDIAKDAFDKMVDHACDETVIDRIRELALHTDGVLSLDDLKTRRFGNKSYVDIEIGVDSELNIVAAHEIAEALHDGIERELPEVKHCMVHVNPYYRSEGQ